MNLLDFNNWIQITESARNLTNYSKNNLDVTQYRNGDSIPEVKDPSEWSTLTTGAFCYYDNDSANGPTYGKLYNWYAVNDPRGLAPVGWKIPTVDELEKIDLTNGLPGGGRGSSGNYSTIGAYGYLWSSTEADGNTDCALNRTLYYSNGNPYINNSNKTYGLSVMCIPDFDDVMLNLFSDF